MGQAELLIAGLLVAVAGLSALARRLSVPYPIVLVVGGALIGFVPGLPEVELDPEVVLVVFLPPLLHASSIFANFGDFRANLHALILSTIGLVLTSMCAVAWAAHTLIPGLPWEAAFVLGAGGLVVGRETADRLQGERLFLEYVPDRRPVRPPTRTDVADPGGFVQVERRMLGLEVHDEAT